MDIFPIAQFPPSAWRWDIAGTPVSGGAPVSGVPQTADAAGGGWWTCDLSVAQLATIAQHKAWRALAGRLKTAAGIMAVPIIDACQPWPGGVVGAGASRFTSAVAFSAGTVFGTDTINAVLYADAYAPAWPTPAAPPTQAQIHMITGAALEGGVFFSLTGASGKPRLHLIDTIISVAGAVYTVSFSPPLREDYASGVRVELDSPFCTMKLDPASVGNVLQQYGAGFTAAPSIRFVESL